MHLLLNCNNCNYDWIEAFMKASTFESGIPFIFAELILHLYQYGNITFNTRMTRFLKMYSQYPHPSVMAVQPLFCHIWGVYQTSISDIYHIPISDILSYPSFSLSQRAAELITFIFNELRWGKRTHEILPCQSHVWNIFIIPIMGIGCVGSLRMNAWGRNAVKAQVTTLTGPIQTITPVSKYILPSK